MSEAKKDFEKTEKPISCFECEYFGVISEITVFPSLCEKNWLWFDCHGNYGVKKERKENDKKVSEKRKEKETVLKMGKTLLKTLEGQSLLKESFSILDKIRKDIGLEDQNEVE